MTPPPTMTTRARVGRSMAIAQALIRALSGSNAGGAEHVGAAALALDAARRRRCPARRTAGSTQANARLLLHAMSVAAGGGDADAASAGEHRLAAARIGVGRIDFGIDDLEGPRRLRERRRLADEVAFVHVEEARHIRLEHVELVGELGRPGLVALLDAHAVDRVQAVVRDAEMRGRAPRAHRTERGSEPIGGCSSQPSSPT